MKNLMLTILFSLCSMFSSHLFAQDEYVCLKEEVERKISVVYISPTSTVPCEVVYEKPSGTQTLWTAQSEEGFCESKAAELVEKQKSWGWDCAKMNEISNSDA